MEQNDWSSNRDRLEAERRRRRMHRYGRGPGGNPGVGFAVAIVLVGVLFLLRNLDIVEFRNIGQLWPLALAIPGVSMLVNARYTGQVVTGLVMTGMGGYFLARNFGYVDPALMQWFWPALLIGAGILMLFNGVDGGAPYDGWRGGPGQPPRDGSPRDPQQSGPTGPTSQQRAMNSW